MILVPSFLPFAFIIAYLYARLAPAYILASRDLRRLELTSLSQTFAGFDELLAVRLCFPIHDSESPHQGLSHVRAFSMESWYQDRFSKRVDELQCFDHVYVSIIVFVASTRAL